LVVLAAGSPARLHVEPVLDVRLRPPPDSTIAAPGSPTYRYDGSGIATIGSRRGGQGWVSGDFYNYDGLVRSIQAQFTAKLRDYESGLNRYFGARYFSGAMGRFTTPDAPFADQSPEDPQSWNLYGYVRNNPLKFVDPDGRAYKICNQEGDCGVYSDDDYDELRGNESYIVANGKIYSRNEDGTQGDQLGTAGYWGEDLSDLGQGVVGGLAERADASNQMIAGVAVGSAAVGASAALAPVAGQAVNELAFGAATGRLFWDHAGRAAAYADRTGRVIANSPLGKLWEQTSAKLKLSSSVEYAGWQVLSRFWASGAGGSVKVHGNYSGRILTTVELPVLLSNPNVFKSTILR
jgi:RHS repeat-associated protein